MERRPGAEGEKGRAVGGEEEIKRLKKGFCGGLRGTLRLKSRAARHARTRSLSRRIGLRDITTAHLSLSRARARDKRT